MQRILLPELQAPHCTKPYGKASISSGASSATTEFLQKTYARCSWPLSSEAFALHMTSTSMITQYTSVYHFRHYIFNDSYDNFALDIFQNMFVFL